jgi:hypothetical protein
VHQIAFLEQLPKSGQGTGVRTLPETRQEEQGRGDIWQMLVVQQGQDVSHTYFPQMHAPEAGAGTERYLGPA